MQNRNSEVRHAASVTYASICLCTRGRGDKEADLRGPTYPNASVDASRGRLEPICSGSPAFVVKEERRLCRTHTPLT